MRAWSDYNKGISNVDFKVEEGKGHTVSLFSRIMSIRWIHCQLNEAENKTTSFLLWIFAKTGTIDLGTTDIY